MPWWGCPPCYLSAQTHGRGRRRSRVSAQGWLLTGGWIQVVPDKKGMEILVSATLGTELNH